MADDAERIEYNQYERVGRNMASIKDIAREAGVSIGTVDRVLHNRGRVSDETKARIEAVMDQLNYKPNHVAQGLAVTKKKLNLCFCVLDSERNPFYYDIRKAAEKRAVKLKQYGVTVNICVIDPDNEMKNYLTKEVRGALDHADGIATIGFVSSEFRKELKKAMDRKVPIVFYNSRLDEIKPLAFVGCNYIDSGRLAAGIAARIGGKDAKVGVFTQGYELSKQMVSYTERMLGFQREIEERYPNMEIVDTRNISLETRQNEETVKEVLQRYPDMNIAYIVNPADYEICEELYKADKNHKIKIITNDLVGRQIEMVKNDIISVTICQEPEKQGDQPLDILFQYLAYGIRPEKEDIYTRLSIHIAQNIY